MEPVGRIIRGAAPEGVAEFLGRYPEIYMVYDSRAEVHAERIRKALLPSGALRSVCSIETSEEGKTVGTVLELEDWLLRSGADRNALLLAVGGGITTDIAGFTACIYKRGIRFAFVPTTLLSQVDAAIGGKTGVNFRDYKNMLGIIRQPEFTYICPQVLDSLPYREFVAGSAEMLKTFIISGGHDYRRAVSILGEIWSKNGDFEGYGPDIQELVMKAAGVKAAIVSRDENEIGERRKLNLGHTFAHAIEHEARLQGRDISHGEAVAIGIVQAARLADEGFAEELKNDFDGCGLPTELPFSLESLKDAMTLDKKAEGETVHFIVPYAIGDVRIVDLTVEEAVSRLI
ncbi:MAG: 3-dehydroquinate synthase [Bacteroidales bacterium]|nr:3-dehydroquinate synthase [Bacteroidales bacterium]